MTDSRDSTPPDAEVVIIGAGPVGCTLAIDLAIAGVRTIVMERRPADARPHPGTNLTNIRSMEHLRRWGATAHVRAATKIGPEFARDAQFPTRGNGYMMAELPDAFADMGPLPFASALPHFGPQSAVERGLRTRLQELPAAELRFETTFERFEQDEDEVTVVCRTPDGQEHSVRSVYLVAADGSRSGVRAQLGIRMEGTQRMAGGTAWYIHSPAIRDLLAEHHGSAVFVWFTNEDRNGVLLIAQDSDGTFQYMDVPLEEGADGDDWELMRARLWKAVGAEVPVEPLEGGAFWINSLVAPRFHSGRVFLAGESAHHISVVGGFGMNTGIGDAADLGWKLTAQIHGWAGPELFASYDAERIPVVRWVRDLTEESTRHLGHTAQAGMEEPGPVGDALRAKIGAQILEEKRQEVVSLGAQLGAVYYDSPIVVSDGTRAPHATFGEYIPSASPGARAPHVWLGEDDSLFDHIAHEGFTLLRFTSALDTTRLEEAAATRGVPLHVVTLENPQVAKLYAAAMALVRPDLHIAWRGSQAPSNPERVIDILRGATSPPAVPTSTVDDRDQVPVVPHY